MANADFEIRFKTNQKKVTINPRLEETHLVRHKARFAKVLRQLKKETRLTRHKSSFAKILQELPAKRVTLLQFMDKQLGKNNKEFHLSLNSLQKIILLIDSVIRKLHLFIQREHRLIERKSLAGHRALLDKMQKEYASLKSLKEKTLSTIKSISRLNQSHYQQLLEEPQFKNRIIAQLRKKFPGYTYTTTRYAINNAIKENNLIPLFIADRYTKNDVFNMGTNLCEENLEKESLAIKNQYR